MSVSSMESVSSLFYHRYLKGESLYSEVDSPIVESEKVSKSSSTYEWDLQESCKPMFAAFDYISNQLSHKGLSMHLIISNQHPFVIPVWQLPVESQITLCKIARSACQKFDITSNWITVLASSDQKDLRGMFESFKPDAYIIRKSILQQETVYASEGLTLLCIDHIFTLKQMLCTLSNTEFTSESRESCLTSCVHLLHRIHSIYTGKPASAAYIERVYREIPFQNAQLEEVVTEYNARYCTATIYEVNFQPDFSSAHLDDDSSASRPSSNPTLELPETTRHSQPKSASSWHELVSPLETELDMVRIWEAIPLGPNPDDKDVMPSPASMIHFPLPNPSSLQPPSIPPIATASQVPFPPAASPPPSYPVPAPPPPPPSPPMQHLPPSYYNTISSFASESDFHDISPAPLRINKRASTQTYTFPPPPGYRGSTLPALAPSASDNTGSAVDGEFLWEINVLESPRSYIESWSRMTEGALCQRCHEVMLSEN